MKTILERFMDKVAFEPMSGCWLWMGSNGTGGYGMSWNGQRTLTAHRHSYELFRSPVPKGLHIDHMCRNRACVNPDHLRAVTPLQNMFADGSLCFGKLNKSKPHCPKCGGEFSMKASGSACYCRPCTIAGIKKWKQENKQRISETDAAYYRANRERAAMLQRQRNARKKHHILPE